MKHKIFFAICLLLTVSSCSKKQTIIINGHLQDGKSEMIWLDRLNINVTIPLDSQKINNKNEFRFKIKGEQPEIYMIRNNQGRFISLLTHPGERIHITGHYNAPVRTYSVSGSPESEKIQSLVTKLEDTKSRLRDLDKSIEGLTGIPESKVLEFASQKQAIIKEQRDFSIRFIMENLNSLASIYALYQTYGPDQLVLNEPRDLQYMKIVADTLSEKYPGVPLVTSFVNDARASELRYSNLLKLSEFMRGANTGLPDLAMPSVSGKIINLSSLKGKTVLLYVWAAQDKASRQQNPSLLGTYKTYRNKGFEVYAVSLDNDKESWERAVFMDELDWINVIEDDNSTSRASIIYNIQKLPTNYLLNSSGEIIARDLYGRELERWLDNVLN